MARLPTAAFVFLATLGLALAQPKQPVAGASVWYRPQRVREMSPKPYVLRFWGT